MLDDMPAPFTSIDKTPLKKRSCNNLGDRRKKSPSKPFNITFSSHLKMAISSFTILIICPLMKLEPSEFLKSHGSDMIMS